MELSGVPSTYSEKQVIHFLCTVVNICGVFVAFTLQFLPAEYGRYFNSVKSTSKWGFGIHPKVAWFLQEIPMFAFPLFFLLTSDGGKLGLTPNFVLVSLVLLHYFRRVFIYPFQLKGGKPTPFMLWLLASLYTLASGYSLGCYLTRIESYDPTWFYDPRFILGVILFFTGMAFNIQSDSILTNLRKPGETGYKIPRGGLFEFVSGANFFSEILEWCGFAIACWNYPAFTYAFFTLCNVGPRACQHHKFYLEKFDDYPKSRKALIPFIL